MLTKKELERLGIAVEELVAEARAIRDKRKMRYPTIERWSSRGAREDGVFFSQDGDEIWLTAKHARQLIQDLKKFYPDKK